MKPYFITGTGTGIGKTLVTCALAYQLMAAGKTVRVLKPVISGFDKGAIEDSDTALLLASQGLERSPSNIDAVSPWRFKAPLSPDMAAEDEGRAIDVASLIHYCKMKANADYLLVEGVGGVMVPLDHAHTVLDWAAALRFPVILVAGSYLGALSHTLTAARALLDAGLFLHGVVISESEASLVPLSRAEASLRRFLPRQTRFAEIGRLDCSGELWKDAPDIAQRLFS